MKNKLFNIIVVVLAVIFISATIAEAGSHGSRDRRDRNGYSNHDRNRHHHKDRRHHHKHRGNRRDFVNALGLIAGTVIVTTVVDAMINPRTYVVDNRAANEPPPMAQVWVEGHWERGTWIPGHYEWIQVGPGAQ